mmetsp:Transcript_9462/g.22385  ORF Transcript_9462/g.22385 Transcript_9462/m.22385 type:complete len:211 (-) Transcript_9462:233-865(-)
MIAFAWMVPAVFGACAVREPCKPLRKRGWLVARARTHHRNGDRECRRWWDLVVVVVRRSEILGVPVDAEERMLRSNRPRVSRHSAPIQRTRSLPQKTHRAVLAVLGSRTGDLLVCSRALVFSHRNRTTVDLLHGPTEQNKRWGENQGLRPRVSLGTVPCSEQRCLLCCVVIIVLETERNGTRLRRSDQLNNASSVFRGPKNQPICRNNNE